MSVRFSTTIGLVDNDLLDEIVDWLEERQIHYRPYMITGTALDQAYLRIDFDNAQDLILFKLTWA